MNRVSASYLALLLSCSAVSLFLAVDVFWPSHSANDGLFKIHFLDVGQGDAVLIQTPEGVEVLIDGGSHRGVLREIAAQQAWHDRHIDMVIATHADNDHVGGLVDVLDHYGVDIILETQAAGESPGAAAFSAAMAAENAAILPAQAGQIIQLGSSTTIHVLAPTQSTENWRPNTSSIIVRITHGDTAVMLTGDAPSSVEDFLVGVYDADQLQSNILKLGHHGSKTSTSERFLDAVSPQYAVVSAGIDNSYGHPHTSVLQRVFDRNIATFHTGTDGTVTFYSDGKRVWQGE